MLDSYEINKTTLAVLPISDTISKVIEDENVFLISKPPIEVIDESCKYFGSSYIGRSEGTKSLLGFNYKSPIIIEEKNDLIFFPTCSPRQNSCQWISLNNIKNCIKKDNSSIIMFKSGVILEISMSYSML